MFTSRVNTCSVISANNRSEFQGRGPTRIIGKLSNEYETSYQRVARIRDNQKTAATRLHAHDQILAHPERFKSGTLRGLIHLSRYLEEVGENIADISGLTERVTKNIMSSGEKFDMAKIAASGAGRLVAAQMNVLGFSINKAVGALCYLLSSAISVAVLTFANSKHARLRNPEELQKALASRSCPQSLYLLVARKLLSVKEAQIEKVLKYTNNSNNPTVKCIRKWARGLSRNHRSVPEYLVNKRKAHSNYMFNNMHQYGPLTRGLLQVSYASYQGVNKLMVSFDKLIGTVMGRRLLAKKCGELLGCRLALTAMIAASTAISVPMSPLIVGVSMAGAIVCGFALVALILAKINVHMNDDWKGNICDSKQIRFLAA